ncbi:MULTISPECIES: amidohydrolase family protein [unclassified Streptomyces]|uniref:amidohydrolase family protein n=1 Tax=unclassified Streptomyces TaxID=2593676 RepID=UPI003426D026
MNTPSVPVNRLIDVHHHAELEVMKAKRAELGVPLPSFVPEWTPQIGIERMDLTGTTLSVLSIPGGASFCPPAEQAAFTRTINESLADLIREHPTRYGAFACLPMPDPDACVKEAVHALDELGLDGVCMHTSYDGAYLSDPAYTDLLAELDRRATPVFTHPILPEPVADLPPALLEGTFDTTRMATKLAGADVFARFPGIRFILPHTGGMVPYLKWRIAMYKLTGADWRIETDPADVPREIAKLDGIYYDTTLNMGPVQKLESHERILFGTDIPFSCDSVLGIQRESVFADAAALGQDHVDAIAYGNAFRLFPKIAERLS